MTQHTTLTVEETEEAFIARCKQEVRNVLRAAFYGRMSEEAFLAWVDALTPYRKQRGSLLMAYIAKQRAERGERRMQTIKPIETIYNGYRFRSRLEARWAVFFDTLGIKYHYEYEGFNLNKVGWYLPDFWLPDIDTWVEIKGQEPTEEEREKCKKLADFNQATCILVSGDCWPREYTLFIYRNMWNDETEEKEAYEIATDAFFSICRRCSGLWYRNEDRSSYGAFQCEPGCTSERVPVNDDPRLISAYAAARQARFEHGEHGEAPQYSSDTKVRLEQQIQRRQQQRRQQAIDRATKRKLLLQESLREYMDNHKLNS